MLPPLPLPVDWQAGSGPRTNNRQVRAKNLRAIIMNCSIPTETTLERIFRTFNHRTLSASISIMLLLLVSLDCVSVISMASSGSQRQPSAATNAYGEPIKWSFGGWAPLDGQQPGARRNQTGAGSTTPLPPMDPADPHRTTAAAINYHPGNGAANGTQRQQQNQQYVRRPGVDAMSESASSTHGKVQFVAPQPESSHVQHQVRAHQPNHQIQSGPAYALSMQGQTQGLGHFSPPAPVPIVREHLLQAAANYPQGQARARIPHNMTNQSHHHQQQQQPHHHHHHQHQQHHHHHHHHHHHQQQQQQQHQLAPGQQYPRPPMSIHEHQRRLEHQHRQQMMHHHQMMMQHQLTQPAQEAKLGQLPGGQHLARYPQQSGPVIEGYRLVEGEHPMIFTPPAGMMELAAANRTNQHSQEHLASSRAPYASTVGAVDKDHLNYGNTLRQVNSADESPLSNNIQDIKQKQQQRDHQNFQQQQPVQSSQDKQEHNKAGSYLTIPVAVETEGDKVLTADDINEIEKHVIQVLPNLKTADKVVKLADTKLTLASASPKDAVAIEQIAATAAAAAASGPASLHHLNYEEHRSTMKQLESDLTSSNDNKQYSQRYESSTTPLPASRSTPSGAYGASGPALNSATTNAHVLHQQPKSIDDGNSQLPEQQYFLATGPMQEVGSVDPDQLAEYNLIKNDLLQNFRYEPTRASSSGGSQHNSHQQTASTPPMANTATQAQYKPASVTRYFQQGNRMYQQHQLEPANRAAQQPTRNNIYKGNNNLFGRIQNPATKSHAQQQSSTTKTILGGRKVSEVMRNLIHTTPVPMTSPMHVPSVEPEKVDAIQLIASYGNDNKPMVVEPHQLIQHTPEGGLNYISGSAMSANNGSLGGQQQQQYEQQNEGQRAQYGPPQMAVDQTGGADGQQQPGGAIIEYVAVGDQALQGSLGSGQNEGTYEIASQPEIQPVYQNGEEQQQQQHHPQHEQVNDGSHSSRPPFVYDYTMSADQQQTSSPGGGSTNSEQSGPTTYSMSPSSVQHHHQQQQQAEEPQMFTWSPSIANEHQQQQAELNEHAAPGHQMDMPATAGYNFFSQSNEQQPSKETGQDYEQQYREPQQNGKWRSKAGGSQPNPDAQYDGQIVKVASDHESDHEAAQNNQQPSEEQQFNSVGGSTYKTANNEQLARLSMGTRGPENHGDTDGYQQKQQQQGYQQQEQQSPTTPTNQPANSDGYLATNSYAAGAQFNHQTPSHENYDQQRDYDQSRQQPTRYNYVKLDHDRQQSHLAQQQAQRQAQMAEIMNNQQQVYQTTTPVTLTTLASADAQQHRQSGEDRSQQPTQSDYGQDQSLPSVQSSPESMLINESPMSMPILDQQSLISDPSLDSNQGLSSDDGAKQSQPAAVYQVYQAYYAPKDHKPLPGYVRLSLEEFNELFRDAEIQYVDRNNLNGMNAGPSRQQQEGSEEQHAYEQGQTSGGNQNDLIKASASENQSIVVDRRSIGSERRSSNATATESSENKPSKLKFAGAVKKIISIRNSRQAARQQLLKSTILKHKAQNHHQRYPKIDSPSSTTSPFSSPASGNNHPTTKQELIVSQPAAVDHDHKSNGKQQSSDKMKPDGLTATAASFKKSLLQSQPTKATALFKDTKLDKSKVGPADVGAKRTSSIPNGKSGSKAAEHRATK